MDLRVSTYTFYVYQPLFSPSILPLRFLLVFFNQRFGVQSHSSRFNSIIAVDYFYTLDKRKQNFKKQSGYLIIVLNYRNNGSMIDRFAITFTDRLLLI